MAVYVNPRDSQFTVHTGAQTQVVVDYVDERYLAFHHDNALYIPEHVLWFVWGFPGGSPANEADLPAKLTATERTWVFAVSTVRQPLRITQANVGPRSMGGAGLGASFWLSGGWRPATGYITLTDSAGAGIETFAGFQFDPIARTISIEGDGPDVSTGTETYCLDIPTRQSGELEPFQDVRGRPIEALHWCFQWPSSSTYLPDRGK